MQRLQPLRQDQIRSWRLRRWLVSQKTSQAASWLTLNFVPFLSTNTQWIFGLWLFKSFTVASVDTVTKLAQYIYIFWGGGKHLIGSFYIILFNCDIQFWVQKITTSPTSGTLQWSYLLITKQSYLNVCKYILSCNSKLKGFFFLKYFCINLLMSPRKRNLLPYLEPCVTHIYKHSNSEGAHGLFTRFFPTQANWSSVKLPSTAAQMQGGRKTTS